MKLSDLDKYIVDMVSDDYYCLWEVIAYDDYLIETGIGHDPKAIKKAAQKLLTSGLIELIYGNLESENVKTITKEKAITILSEDTNWKRPLKQKEVYALYATEKGEKMIMGKGH